MSSSLSTEDTRTTLLNGFPNRWGVASTSATPEPGRNWKSLECPSPARMVSHPSLTSTTCTESDVTPTFPGQINSMCKAALLLFHPDKILNPSSEEVMFCLLVQSFGCGAPSHLATGLSLKRQRPLPESHVMMNGQKQQVYPKLRQHARASWVFDARRPQRPPEAHVLPLSESQKLEVCRFSTDVSNTFPSLASGTTRRRGSAPPSGRPWAEVGG